MPPVAASACDAAHTHTHPAWAAQCIRHCPDHALAHSPSLTANLRQPPCPCRGPQAPPWTCASSSSAVRRRWPRSGACWSMCAPAHLRCTPAGSFADPCACVVERAGPASLPPQGQARCTSMFHEIPLLRLTGPGQTAHTVLSQLQSWLHMTRSRPLHCVHVDLHATDSCQPCGSLSPNPRSPTLPVTALNKARWLCCAQHSMGRPSVSTRGGTHQDRPVQAVLELHV